MKERTLQILAALIDDFINTANPVASKKLLMSREDLDISSATVRSEFSLLEEVGLIRSPHISAGKVPTQKGYRFFIDELLHENEQDTIYIKSIFEKHIGNYRLSKKKESIFDMLQLVAHLSGNVAFVTIENDRTFYLGLSNVLRSPEFMADPQKGAQIVEIFEGRDKFKIMLKNLNLPIGEVKIFVGEENLLEEINSCAMLVLRFQNKDIAGTIGILGPMRMRYGFNKALLENALKML